MQTVRSEDNPPKKEEFKRPPIDLLQDLKDGINHVVYNPLGNKIVMPLMFLLESVLLKYVIAAIPYTEIDYKAYMEQVEMIYEEGNYNYLEITGGTGPLVYPAGHVLIFRVLNYFTEGMNHIEVGQKIFRYLYLITLLMQYTCYYQLRLPPWCVVLASLSKRLHSIYVLRLFNDCFTTFFMVLFVLLYTLRSNNSTKMSMVISTFGSLVYSMAISVKMNALLYLPGYLVSTYLINEGKLINCLISASVILFWQVIVSLRFLRSYPVEYLAGAFDFSRQFMFKWSVNWQFLDEDAFQDRVFHTTLLGSQFVAVVAMTLCLYPRLPLDAWKSLKAPFTQVVIADLRFIVPFLLMTSNFIGVLFSRSLHYQFLSWYHWTLPCLIYWSKLPMPLGFIWYICHEYCWNSYPPNEKACILLFTLNASLLCLLAINCMRPVIVNIKRKQQ
ncbi:Man(5)GlcNAc(2)-PP-Dol alpha-1,3-mannosyltransferase [Nakaseomyces glabratus]|uniref:Dol-P-Man:Man(5)GlcNAc(2)-PP-Dol alpha-1,3-mannosyltransferase n=1 Tax=Candida glabrata TaxID=5478 RepID=A0A0W0CNI3_CANGB|nr:Man(5)GlcNAc(2)-PP-Dol alpha-1,3-mannosyltransferase [Nakaseomyces glabratus]KTB00958.1 Man(5)GlcNAc(2)-PP-Dol alpha-1,3-mannosyltransferase [Nakaseomyces glabratus]KTB00975.1 Man(5)GlcNAc(2)-PP-Dol alpha-1,3-mannosyltransferase [Nakaseomyces glabratus]KTB18424.1 Man(5)GlcNAc(2)-PP-Dol alpha-1,3-mannosyltransferase [Nakaseomyces glabratus]